MKDQIGSPSDWEPTSWRTKPAQQQPNYPDPKAVDRVVTEIASLPPLVTSWEVEALKHKLGMASRGEAFLLQGGDCAESFADCSSAVITAKLKILLQVSLVLAHGTRKEVIRVGRIAGQYAKPRSTDMETRDGVTLPSYRGDSVNRPGFNEKDRVPDPELMLRAYERSALTLNFIRALSDGGFADLHHPEYWDLSFLQHSQRSAEYERIVESIREAIDFMEAVGNVRLAHLSTIDFYTSHEGLSLHYEEAQTRQVPRRPGWYNLSTHLPWIGMRTAQIGGAHVDYFRGIRNPIAIKIGPGMTKEWLEELISVMHPHNEPGRLTLVHRLGADKVAGQLPEFIETVRRTGKTVLWTVDPMHGNTETTADGIKTRRFENILREIEQSFAVHIELGSILGGVHFELTGDDVTECVGGARGLDEAGLKRAYRSQVDPRLNYEQALEMAMLVARHMRMQRQLKRDAG